MVQWSVLRRMHQQRRGMNNEKLKNEKNTSYPCYAIEHGFSPKVSGCDGWWRDFSRAACKIRPPSVASVGIRVLLRRKGIEV